MYHRNTRNSNSIIMTQSDYTLTPKGRFAPSPSGRMHLGNLFSALISWLSVKSRGGNWVLRIEDLDPGRSRQQHADRIMSDLEWLGLTWDEGPYYQSRRHDLYAEALRSLEATGLTYPCYCTRADIMATQAPHQSDGRIVYPGTCRPPHRDSSCPLPHQDSTCLAPHRLSTGRKPSTRLMVEDADITFDDLFMGPHTYNLARECGDFILRRADGAWAYQLAVVVDDADMGITEVVRGNDLLLSAAQQTYLYRLLGHRAPRFAHVPLLCNHAGQRLSKRDASLSLDILRDTGAATPESILGRLAHLAGLLPQPTPIPAADLLPLYTPARICSLPTSVIV